MDDILDIVCVVAFEVDSCYTLFFSTKERLSFKQFWVKKIMKKIYIIGTNIRRRFFLAACFRESIADLEGILVKQVS